jgi:hypothetical protein
MSAMAARILLALTLGLQTVAFAIDKLPPESCAASNSGICNGTCRNETETALRQLQSFLRANSSKVGGHDSVNSRWSAASRWSGAGALAQACCERLIRV